MALTYTPEAEMGNECPGFELPHVDGSTFNYKQASEAPAKLIMFICAHCPYVQAIEDRLIQLGKDLQPKGVAVVGICSNDSTDYPEDQPESLLKRWQEKEYGFPYLIDESQTVAKSFGAVCTPDFFVYDSDDRLVYRGRLDDSWKDPMAVTQEELKEALLNTIEKKPLNSQQIPSMGCSIKWKNT